MPIYTYKCDSCDAHFEKLFTSMSSACEFVNEVKCKCGKKAKRTYTSPPAVFFKFSDRAKYSDPTDNNK